MANTVSGYNILTVIGSGTFGTCHKVIRKDTGEIFVWKAVDYGRMSEEKKKLLVSEVNLLSSLDHPNIVKYYDRIIHKPTTTIYIVMEWCAGGDLSTLINQCKKTNMKLEEKFIWRVLYQLSRALQLCHLLHPEGPVLHRDIKPANVFLDGNGNVKLGDFGLAYLLEEGQRSVSSTSVVGTPFYMSPEVLQDSLYSEKSDIWSLGCSLYELCALELPFDGSNLQQLIRSVQIGRFDRIPMEYSDDLHEIISYMLTVDHRSRPNVEVILHHPQVIMHIVQESLELLKWKSHRPSDPESDLQYKSRKDILPPSESSCGCIGEVARLKDTLNFRIGELQEWEAMLTKRELELNKKERSIKKREKLIARSERVTQAENIFHKCQYLHSGTNQKNKPEAFNADFPVFKDEGDSSFVHSTSTKLNPHVVERPAGFPQATSVKRVHFGTLPNLKSKCLPQNELNNKSMSHLLIDNCQVNLTMKQSIKKTENSSKFNSNKMKRSCTVVDADGCRSGSSVSSRSTGLLQWDDERRFWLEQKRVQYFCNIKENIPTTKSVAACQISPNYQRKLNVAMRENYHMNKH